MFFTRPELTAGSRPTLLPDENLLYVQDSVGLYEGKYKIAACQKGHAYLTSHRVCYIDDVDARNCSVAVDLKDVERHEFQAGFLRSSAKITLHPKPLKRGYGSLRQHIASPSPVVQRLSSASSPVSRVPSPPIKAASQQIDRGTWICPICSFSNPVPSNFDPTIATDAFPLPPCLTCGIKPEFPIVLKAAIAARTKHAAATANSPRPEPSPQQLHSPDSAEYIICPKCTFHNHPGLRTCEMCNTPLPDRISTVAPAELERPVSPGPEISNLSLDEDHENTSIKLSFRAGGDKVFYDRLKNAMIQRRWLLQHAPPVPRPDSEPSTTPDNSTPPPSRPQSTAVGIAGLEQRGLQSRRNNEAVLGNAFADLEALMASAKDIVALAEKFAAESGSSDPVLSESATALGMMATKDTVSDSSNSLYISELSRNLAEYVTDERRGVLRLNGGIMSLVDLWATINRSRNGFELISPADFHQAAEAWERLNLPVRLRQFRSGVLVVQPKDWTDEKSVARITSWLQSMRQSRPEEPTSWDWDEFGCGVTAQEAASRFGWSLGVATEELEMAEERGVLCREEGVEGLKFWLNYLTAPDDLLI
jgi:ESCRT-II complex subunit VPS36